MKNLHTYTYGPVSGNEPKQIIILLHGLGSNGQDLISLAPYYAGGLPDAVFVSPDAPFACDMAPPELQNNSFQWFSLQSREPQDILDGVERAAPILDHFIKGQLENYNLPASKLALVGFSQGTMMSLYTGLRYPETIAGILGYSGALIWDQDADASQLQKLPVHLIHGDADMVVPVTSYHRAKDMLEANGYTVTGHVTPGLEHSIDGQGIESGTEFLKNLF